jgi:hypothetical protein
VNGSQNPPLSDKLMPVVNPRELVNPVQPATSACTGCHVSRDALSHALVNMPRCLAKAGRHGTNADFRIAKATHGNLLRLVLARRYQAHGF